MQFTFLSVSVISREVKIFAQIIILYNRVGFSVTKREKRYLLSWHIRIQMVEIEFTLIESNIFAPLFLPSVWSISHKAFLFFILNWRSNRLAFKGKLLWKKSEQSTIEMEKNDNFLQSCIACVVLRCMLFRVLAYTHLYCLIVCHGSKSKWKQTDLNMNFSGLYACYSVQSSHIIENFNRNFKWLAFSSLEKLFTVVWCSHKLEISNNIALAIAKHH